MLVSYLDKLSSEEFIHSKNKNTELESISIIYQFYYVILFWGTY